MTEYLLADVYSDFPADLERAPHNLIDYAVSVLRDNPILWMKVEGFGHDPNRPCTEWAYDTWGTHGVEAITGRWVMIVDSPPGGQFEVSVRKLAACYVYAPLQAAA